MRILYPDLNLFMILYKTKNIFNLVIISIMLQLYDKACEMCVLSESAEY